MDIKDFLPAYPNIQNTKYDMLNPYEEDFYEALFHKKEFYENRLDRVEVFPKERGALTKYQKTVVRYISNHTPYDRLLLVHFMGSGKTCSAIGAIENIKNETNIFTGALILAKGEKIHNLFRKALVETCTAGQYIPENFSKLTALEKKHRIRKKIQFYQFRTFATFAKDLRGMSDSDIVQKYSNKIVVADEIHNLRIQEGADKEETKETYTQFHRFFHLIQNCKVLFLSGTPMKDGPEELASVANLLLPLNKQFPTGEEFINEFLIKEGGERYTISDEKGNEIKNRLKGYISFLKEAESSVAKQFIGKTGIGGLEHFVVSPNKMSEFQTKGYISAYNKDTGGQAGVWINSRGASLFVYPDGSYGKEGFTKYIKKKTDDTFQLTKELKDVIQGANNEETLNNLKKYSATYADVIKHILDTNGNCFVYSSLLRGSGAILFSLILELFGMKKANGTEKEPGLRYALLSEEVITTNAIERITEQFNSKQNVHGKLIKVVIGTKAISEGFSFKNVIFEAILTPHWNYSEIAQALARGIRLGSHNELLKENPNVVVRILQVASIPRADIPSVDLVNWKTAEDKDISIRTILRLLMETAFDCALNYIRNRVEGVNNSRECDYTTCEYKCDGINMAEIENGIDDKDLDYSTYQLYYANPKTPLILKKIEQLFRMVKKIDLNSIIKNLQGQFTEEEIQNTLFIIQSETEDDVFDYKTFLDLYSRTPVKKIATSIEELFREHFNLSLMDILKYFPNYTKFEVITALQTIINDSIIITNKYGISCYLKEENDSYFLVNSLSASPEFYTEYYARFPHVIRKRTFEEILNRIYSLTLPRTIQKLCKLKAKDKDEFINIMKSLPKEIQELFIENSIIAQEQGLNHNVEFRELVLDYFKSYIKQINDTWVSTLGELKCKKPGEAWKPCTEQFVSVLQEYEDKKREQSKKENKYGIVGKYNPENKSFCIVDYEKETETQSKKTKVDKRLNYSGKVCGAGGWKLPELMTIAIKRLKIAPPDNFSFKDTAGLRLKVKNEPKLREIFTDEEFKTMSEGMLKRAVYWGFTKKDGGNRGIKQICSAIQSWFEEKGLLEIDNMCGVQGKKKTISIKKESKSGFNIKTFVPARDGEEFKAHIPAIRKLMTDCFEVKKYDVQINSDLWIMVFSKSKLIGFVTVDNNNILWNVCVAKNYRNKGVAKQAIKEALEYACNKNKAPTLLVDNRKVCARRLIDMYIGFGFEIAKTDEQYTHMIHNCS